MNLHRPISLHLSSSHHAYWRKNTYFVLKITRTLHMYNNILYRWLYVLHYLLLCDADFFVCLFDIGRGEEC